MNDLINGARWWKFDFHMHTPQSNDYGRGDLNEQNTSPEEWLLKCMESELDCIAITDHNTGEYYDKALIAYEKLKISNPIGFRELHIFPGVELSVNTGVHVLAIFGQNFSSIKIAQIIGECQYKGTFGDSDGVTSCSLESVIEIIHRNGGIAIPAHVDQNAGLFKVLKGPTLTQAIMTNKDHLLALEVKNKSFIFPDCFNQCKLDLAFVTGSDCHKSTEIGRFFTWVKMSSPSIEALKLALHDGNDGVIRFDEINENPNNIDNRYFIKSISVTKGYKAGNRMPMVAKFSPWLTSVIGGRGSGKSSLINYLRIVLDATINMPTEIQKEFDEFNKVFIKQSTGMLRSDTRIEVEILKDGKLQKVTWENNIHSICDWDTSSEKWSTPIVVTNIRSLFPVKIFGQKELFALTKQPDKLMELLDSNFDKRTWQEERKKLEDKWLSLNKRKRELETTVSEESNLNASLISINNKIAIYESSSYKDILKQYTKLNDFKSFIEGISIQTEDFMDKLSSAKAHIPMLSIHESFEDLLSVDESEYMKLMKSTFDDIEKQINQAMENILKYENVLKNRFQNFTWNSKYSQIKFEYTEISKQLSSTDDITYENLQMKKSNILSKLSLVESNKAELSSISDQLSALFSEIMIKEKELRELRLSVIQQWRESESVSNPMLLLDIEPMGNVAQAVTTFRQCIRKEGLEFSQYIYSESPDTSEESQSEPTGIIAILMKEGKENRWAKRDKEIDMFIQGYDSNGKPFDRRLIKHLQNLQSNFPEDIDRLKVWVPDDMLVLKFNKDGKANDISTASAGERSSAMLGLLLKFERTPLIIDQPEDDLDTRIISKFIVEQLKKIKQTRQLVLVTHNPNITVNANSDNIIYMDFSKGQIQIEGNDSLQNPQIRTAVCDVMEGGKPALDKRYYRISKALK